MTTSNGTIQGYSCQTASDELNQIVIATEFFGVGQDPSLLQPMIDHIKSNLGEDCFESSTLLTANIGYSSEENAKYIFDEGIHAVSSRS